LKFGKEVRTPAMQAGIAKKRLSFREIFLEVLLFLLGRDFQKENYCLAA
jgi:hypothetical protein